ncbi:MAG: hypothetical protein RRZ24_01670 [Clostridia bacterium]
MESQQTPFQPVVLSPVEVEHRRKAITAMILGIIGVSIFFLPILNIAGLIVSIIGFVKARENRRFADTNGIKEISMNTAGYICGLIGIIIGAIGIILSFLFIVAVGLFTINIVSTILPTAGCAVSEIFESSAPMPDTFGMVSQAIHGLSALV